MEDKPCCAAAALRKVKQIKIDGTDIGIIHLDEILTEVKVMNLLDESAIEEALLKRVMIYNYVPSNVQRAYQIELLNEYNRRWKDDN